MTAIYNLVSPDGEIRYVGKTAHSPRLRLLSHIHSSKPGVHTHKAHWIRGLLAEGRAPEIRVIGIVPDEVSSLAEQICIFAARHLGARLTNTTAGGEGATGVSPSPETRRKLSEHAKTRTHSDETKAKISAAGRGRVVSAEARKRMSDTKRLKREALELAGVVSKTRLKALRVPTPPRRGWHHTEETRAKLVEAWKHRAPASEATRAKLSSALRARLAQCGGALPISPEAQLRGVETRRRNRKPVSAETRQKMSAAHKGRQVSAETRKRMSAAHTGKQASTETRKRMSDTRKASYEKKRLTAPSVQDTIQAYIDWAGMQEAEAGRL